jgi:hypothetical protein
MVLFRRDNDKEVRVKVGEILVRMGEPAVKALLPFLDDQNWRVSDAGIMGGCGKVFLYTFSIY